MKSLLQKIFINTIAIFIGSQLISGIQWNGEWLTLLSAAFVLSLVNAFVRPFLKILFLPINVITLGLLGWLINVIVIYLTTLIVPGFDIVPFSVNIFGTTIVFNQFFAYIAVSFLLNILTTLTSWLIT